MELKTEAFGLIQVEDGDIVIFPDGLPGFEELTKFTLLGKDVSESPFFWLQSLEKSTLALVVADPFALYEEYVVDVDDEDVAVLQVGNTDQVLTLCVVNIPEDIHQMRVNLKAPILINLQNNLGKQVIQKADLPVRYFLLQ